MNKILIVTVFILAFLSNEYYKIYQENKQLKFQLKQHQIIDSLYNERIQQIYPHRFLNEPVYDMDTINS